MRLPGTASVLVDDVSATTAHPPSEHDLGWPREVAVQVTRPSGLTALRVPFGLPHVTGAQPTTSRYELGRAWREAGTAAADEGADTELAGVGRGARPGDFSVARAMCGSE